MIEGKGHSMSELLSGLQSAMKSVGKQWKKEKLHEDRVSRGKLDYLRSDFPKQTLKDAGFEVMEEAINKASGDGRYLANARQIMYAARPLVLKLTGGNIWKKSEYFTQNILKDYIEAHEEDALIKCIVWDARGKLLEPFTGKIVPLGGAKVTKYIEQWSSEFEMFELPGVQTRISTIGPKHRFNNVLFIEKEGFDAILEASGIAEKYDLAIMSTKGVPVEAACQLVNQLSSEGVKIFVLHDFDFAGFKIVQTLKQGTRLSPGTPVIDLGFRMADIQALESEAVDYPQETDPRYYLKRCGVTENECDFLVHKDSYYRGRWLGQRVELNAMPSDQFISWLEDKLNEHNVQKVLPEETTLTRTYQRAAFYIHLNEEMEKVQKEHIGKNIHVPEDLQDRITDLTRENPTLSWDEAVYQIAEEIEE